MGQVNGRPTIRDVAKAADVSPTTVSYALNNKGALREDTRQHVLRVAREMGYPLPRPKPDEKPLSFGVIYQQGAELSKFEGFETFARFAAGIRQEIECRPGWSLTYAPDTPRNFVFPGFEYGDIDGLIFIGVDRDNPSVVSALEKGVPVVLINRGGHYGTSSVNIANRAAFRDMTRHLIEDHDCRRFSFWIHERDPQYSRERLAGFYDALNQSGIDSNMSQVVHYEDDLGEFAARVRRMAPDLRQVDAALVDQCRFAAPLVRELQAAGVHVPEDLCVVGFDDIKSAFDCDPPLTTVAFDAESIGRAAVQTLIETVRGNLVESHVYLPYSIELRGTCGCDF